MLLTLAACQSHVTDEEKLVQTDQPNLTGEEIKRLVLLNTNYTYPEADAKENAVKLAGQLLKDNTVRTVANLLTVPSRYSLEGKTLIKTDTAIAKPLTPSLYIANFANNNGYIILSADKRVTDIVGIAAGGNINRETFHTGLEVFLSNAIYSMDEKVAQMESLREDSVYNSMLEKLDKAREANIKATANGRTSLEEPCARIHAPGRASNCGIDCYYNSDVIARQTVDNINTSVAPLLTTAWYQGPPYNTITQPCTPDGLLGALCRSTPSSGTAQTGIGICDMPIYKSGCYWASSSAIAEAQVVAYFYAQNSPNRLDWRNLNSRNCPSYTWLDRSLMTELMNSVNDLYLNSGACGISGTNWSDFLKNRPATVISSLYGLKKGEWRDRNDNDTKNSLLRGSPVPIKGAPALCCWAKIWGINIMCTGCGDGFEWVIDGLRDISTTTTTTYRSYYTGSECTEEQYQYSSTYTYTTTSAVTTQVHNNWGTSPDSQKNTWNSINYFSNYGHETKIVAYITPL